MYLEVPVRDWDVVQLAEHLPSTHEVPGFQSRNLSLGQL